MVRCDEHCRYHFRVDRVCAHTENNDFIADMLYTEHKGNTLAVAGGDGCLSVFDLRGGRLLARSDGLDDELLSLALLKGGRKLVCGCQVICLPSGPQTPPSSRL